MKNLLLFAGTTEGRRLSELLADAGIRHTVCVATEYGEIVLKSHPLLTVRQGRMERDEIRAFIEEGNYDTVVDATHPYAETVTANIKAAVGEINASGQDTEGKKILYLRLKRDVSVTDRKEGITFFETAQSCAEALAKTEGNILLTTGSKELAAYCVSEEVKKRLYVRVLPNVESISLCMERGICGKQIIAMQGPFTEAMNEAVLRQYEISVLVTKESGATGGLPEKLEAAKKRRQQYLSWAVRKKKDILFVKYAARLKSCIISESVRRRFFRLPLRGWAWGVRKA